MEIEIKKFKKEYQNVVKDLILCGLEEHWGILNSDFNHDLDDISLNYSNDIFLTAWYKKQLIGTGAAKIETEKAEIVRMSVNSKFRRCGVGYKILDSLIDQLKNRSIKKIILETTESWSEVVTFYINYGFEITHRDKGDIYFRYKV